MAVRRSLQTLRPSERLNQMSPLRWLGRYVCDISRSACPYNIKVTVAPWAEQTAPAAECVGNRWANAVDLNRRITRSRKRIGWCACSTRLLHRIAA